MFPARPRFERLKTLIALCLRAIGFKGSGQNFRLPSDDHWAMLGSQKSTSSDATHVRFTANVLVVSRVAWDAARAEQQVPDPPLVLPAMRRQMK